jgi:hypothetical protein
MKTHKKKIFAFTMKEYVVIDKFVYMLNSEFHDFVWDNVSAETLCQGLNAIKLESDIYDDDDENL